jgi:hypothetical protein
MHEKTVLLPLVIFSLAYPKRPTEVLCITISAMLSMYDLLQRDGHASTYTASMLLLSAAAVSSRQSSFSERCVTAATVCAVVLYHTAQALLPPPAKYPWFYPYLAASLCCARQAPSPPPPPSLPQQAPLSRSQPFVVHRLVVLGRDLPPPCRRRKEKIRVIIKFCLLRKFQMSSATILKYTRSRDKNQSWGRVNATPNKCTEASGAYDQQAALWPRLGA